MRFHRILSFFSMILLVFLFSGCEDLPTSANRDAQVIFQFELSNRQTAPAKSAMTGFIDNIEVEVSGQNMQPIRQQMEIRDKTAYLELKVDKGPDRKFVVTGWSNGDEILRAVRYQDIRNDQEQVDMELPPAEFDVNQTQGPAPLWVDFSYRYPDYGSPVTNINWDLGDGNQQSGDAVNHEYYEPGSYTVRLTVEDDAGSMFTKILPDFILVKPSPVTADFWADYSSGDAPFTAYFYDNSDPGSGNIVSWSWDFGDYGSTDNYSNQQNPTHTYNYSGLYTVTLTVDGSDGSSDTWTATDYIEVTDPPQADFYANPASGTAPLSVSFTDNSHPGTYGSISSYYWEFGDGYSDYGSNPTHTYQTAGVYTVSLTINTTDGKSDTRTYYNFITVN